MSLPFAVVHFKKDGSHSEIPTAWIMKGNLQCRWPKTKNPISLMKRDSFPDIEDWPIYDITVQEYCDNIEKARKKAEDTDYTSTDEVSTGRSIRRKTPLQPIRNCKSDDEHTNDSNSSSDSDSDSIPSLSQSRVVEKPPFKSSQSDVKPQKQKKPLNDKKTNRDANGNSALVLEKTSRQTSFAKSDVGPQHQNQYSHEDEVTTETNPSIEYSDCTTNKSKNQAGPNSRQLPTIKEDILIQPANSVSERRTIVPYPQSIYATTKDIENVLSICLETLEHVKGLAEGLKKIRIQNNPQQTHAFITERLPIRNIDELNAFEECLKNNDHKSYFVEFIKSIGGRDNKQLVQRPLKEIFTNEFAMSCSWLGQRNNHKICDLQCIKVIKGVLTQHSVDQSYVETVTSEWFRLAKLRFDREQKKVPHPKDE